MEEMTNVKAIREYFGTGKHGRKVTMDELKTLTKEERNELGEMAKKELLNVKE